MDTRVRLRAVLSACDGHTLEWYDFGVYAFVATNIARQIFPAANETASLLATFGAFGIGFLSRPLGGIVLGWFGDRLGSKAALVLSFALMGLATLGLGLAPTFEAAGWLAPLWVVVCRLTQGLSAGGEYAISASYLVAWAPEGRRGLYGSFQQAGSAVGALAGSAVGTALSYGLGPESMMAWGWRVPFIIGAVVLVLGLQLRRTAPEAPEHDASIPDQPGTTRLLSNAARATRLFVFAGSWAVPFYMILFYMPTFIQKSLGVDQQTSLAISTIGLLVYVILIPITGRLSDAIGRRRTIMLGGIGCAVLGFVVFPYMVATPSFWTILICQLAMNCSLSLISGPAPATIVEMFPPRRLAWMNGAYAVALAIFGGFTPAALTWIIGATGSPTSPNMLLAAASLICATTMLLSPETAFTSTRVQGTEGGLPPSSVPDHIPVT